MTIAKKETAIWVQVQSAVGAIATITATDVLQAMSLQANPAESARIVERLIIQNSLAPEPSQYGGSLFGFTFEVELKGSGTAGTAPRIGRLLRACGMAETVVASTSVTYQPSSDVPNHDVVTIFYREGPNLRKIIDCRGNCSFTFETGGLLKANFTMMGRISSEAVEAAPAQTVEATRGPVFIGADFQSDADTAAIASLSIDLGNTMSIAPDPNDANGYGEIRVTERKIAGSFDPEANSIAVKDWVGEFRAASLFAVQTGVIGPTAGNQVSVSMPQCQFQNVAEGDRAALLVYDMTYGAFPTSAGDDDLAIQFT